MRRWLSTVGALFALGLGVAGCSSDGGGEAVAITSSATECLVAQTTFEAGRHRFEVENTGNQATEVYVYASGDKVVTEKENIGPGTTATFSVNLDPGRYEIACKPGQTGTGIRQPITVG